MTMTRSEAEARIAESLVRLEREFTGRAADDVVAHICGDLLVARLRGGVAPAERHLVESSDRARGRALVKNAHFELVDRARPLIEATIHGLLSRRVVSLHTDISTTTGERVLVASLESAPDFAPEDTHPED